MTPVTANVALERGADGPMWFEPKANVDNPAAIDLAGSTFQLDIVDITGTSLLQLSIGTPDDGIIRFNLTPDQTAALPAGTATRYTVTRITDTIREVWITGAISAQGIVNG